MSEKNLGEPNLQSALNAFDEAQVHQHLTQANLLRMRGHYDEAVNECAAAMKCSPSSLPAHSLMGDICRDQGRLEDAAQWYRMALDLHHNPIDEARLAEVVNGIQQLLASSLKDQDPEWSGGTSQLIGYSPREHLKLITTLSVVFIIVIVLWLVGNHHNPPARVAGVMPSNTTNTSGVVQTVPVPEASKGTVYGQAGTGMPPDDSGSIGQSSIHPPSVPTTIAPVPTASSNNTTDHSQSGPTIPALPAPVQSQTTTTPIDKWQTSPLSNGFALQNVSNVGEGTVAVQVLAPSLLLQNNTPDRRVVIIRNIYRAARMAFQQSNTYAQAQVFIEVMLPAGEEAIAQASIQRTTARDAQPDTDNPQQLEAGLQNFNVYLSSSTTPSSPSSSSMAGSSTLKNG